MLIIRCTKKLLNELKVTPREEARSSPLMVWHAHLLRIERRKCVLVTNDATLFSLFIPGLKKTDFERFGDVFMEHLFKNLLYEGFSQQQIERVLNEGRETIITKTDSRSVLGSMNDLAFQLECLIQSFGGLDRVDLIPLTQKLNRIPMGAIKYKYGIDALKGIMTE